MKIFYIEKENNNVLVDLAAPIAATEEQVKELKSLLQKLGVQYKTRSVPEKRKQMPGGGEAKDWTDKELMMLFDTDLSEGLLSRKTGHSEFGVVMKRGEILSRYMNWCREKKLDPNDAENRRKFLEGI